MIMQGGKAVYIDAVLSRYRRHGNNVTNLMSPYARQVAADHLLSSIILLTRYPEREIELIPTISVKCRKLRLIMSTGAGYRSVLFASLAFKFNFKALLGILINYFSFGKVKI